MASGDPSYDVVAAVAREEGVSPEELSPPLNRVVDPDALDALAGGASGPDGSPVRIEFEYRDYVVRVGGDGGVEVSARGEGRTAERMESASE